MGTSFYSASKDAEGAMSNLTSQVALDYAKYKFNNVSNFDSRINLDNEMCCSNLGVLFTPLFSLRC